MINKYNIKQVKNDLIFVKDIELKDRLYGDAILMYGADSRDDFNMISVSLIDIYGQKHELINIIVHKKAGISFLKKLIIKEYLEINKKHLDMLQTPMERFLNKLGQLTSKPLTGFFII